MGNYQAYEKYKDSGVEWLGEIPEHWNISRVKFIGNIKYGLGEPPEQLEDGLPIIRATDIYRGVIDGSKIQRVNPDKVPWSRNPELKSGDILVVRSGAYTGDSAIVTDEWAGAIAGYDMVITPTNSYPKYIAWNLLSKHVLEGQLHLAKSRAAQPHLNAEELGNTIISLPLQNEQEQIANFLDRKTKQIDDLIAKKEALLAKLDEKRSAIISHAVTKGLDPTVPMKDSGVDWLGKTPKHWTVLKLGRLCDVTKLTGFEYTKKWITDPNGEIIALRGFNIKNNQLVLNNVERITSELSNELLRSKLYAGDIVFPCTGTLGEGAIIDEDDKYHINQNIAKISPLKDINRKFLLFSLCSDNMKYQIDLNNYSCLQPVLLIGTIRSLIVSIPDFNEQQDIAKYLDKKTAEIDLQKSKVQEAIERLKEYRTALITNAVTGKIDVRQVSLN